MRRFNSKIMTTEKLENKIGFQIGFLLYSGATIFDTVNRLKGIAIEYANAQQPIISLEAERFEWSKTTFPEATALSSLEKMSDEMEEVANELQHGHSGEDLAEEYADCLMCLFDSAGRAGLKPEKLFEAFAQKLEKNKSRTWVKNPNNTYSHVPSKTDA